MVFKVFLSKQARKFLNDSNEELKNRLKMKIKLLSNPYDVDYIKMKGEDDIFRTRLGDYISNSKGRANSCRCKN